jgi:predicted DNA binding CopG/RHH family protein
MEQEKKERREEQEQRGKGRPAKEENKLSRSINLKLTGADFDIITERAASVGMKPTQYARQMVLNGSIKSRYTKEELDLRRKIAGMANSLNQLARRANKDGFEDVGGVLLDLYKELVKLLDDR